MPTLRTSPPPFQLDFRAGLPAYLQIVRQVERKARGGRLRPGDRLPTVRGLALQLGVNFNTVARAYRLLDQAGVVSAQRGRGTYVLELAAAGKARRATLHALAAQYIAEAKRRDFSEAQIAAMVARGLGRRGAAGRAGDDHE